MDRIDDEIVREWVVPRTYSASSRRRRKLMRMHTFSLDDLINSLNNDEVPTLDDSKAPDRGTPNEEIKKGGGYVEVIYGTFPNPKMKFLYKGREVHSLLWIHKDAVTAYKNADYIQLDCSFRATKPFAYCTPQAIVNNEAVPLGFIMTPTESCFTYTTFMEALWNLIPVDELKKDLPVLSDQGLGLSAFCALHKIKQYFCHRHLIEKWSASSFAGMLVARVLKLMTEAEFTLLRLQFIVEAETFNRNRLMSRKQLIAFRKWMALPADPSQPVFLDGIWHRVGQGIARCSNHAERFHGIVNQAIRNARCKALPGRLKILQIEILRRVHQYGVNPRLQVEETWHKLSRQNKCQRDTCDDVDCQNYCAMMRDRVRLDEFPCPHTVRSFLARERSFPTLPTIGDANKESNVKDRELFAHFSRPITSDLSSHNQHPDPEVDERYELHAAILAIPRPKKSFKPGWDDETELPDHGDQLNLSREDRTHAWLTARSIVTGVFSLRARCRKLPQDYDKIRVAHQILTKFEAAFPDFDGMEEVARAQEIADFGLPWYQWAKTNKQWPGDQPIGWAPRTDEVPIVREEISYPNP
jgi:hypothetical protein